MAYIIAESTPQAKKILPRPKLPTSRSSYEIPDRYRDSFYLANASLYDSVNWFLHRAYEVIFPTLKERLNELDSNLTDLQRGEIVERMFKVMDQCNSVIDVRFPVKREDGSFEVLTGFRAQHGLALGYNRSLGGFRMDKSVARDHMKGLSVLATHRNACMGISMSGAHGGIRINPENYTENELQHIVEEYSFALQQKGYCNETDVMQPDINSSSREMTWIARAPSKYAESPHLGVCGKDVNSGGIDSFNEMAYQGVYMAVNQILNNDELMKKCELSPGLAKKTFIIQGLGKIGAPLAQLLVENGAICVGVKEKDAFIYSPKGIDLNKLYEYKRKYGTLAYHDLAKAETSDVIYKEKCDILIFAATHKSLSCYIAGDIKARVIVEAADNPITPVSHRILTGKSQLVVPDIYACSGATVASYVEYLWNLQKLGKLNNQVLRDNNIFRQALEKAQVEHQELAVQSNSITSADPGPFTINRAIMLKTMDNILTSTGKEMFKYIDLLNLGTDVRTAAYLVGINNIFKSLSKQTQFF